MPANPMQPIADATAAIEQRQKRREHAALEHRGAIALEIIADEVTMMRAEMTVMRTLMAHLAAPKR
jgi:hypothetical protein